MKKSLLKIAASTAIAKRMTHPELLRFAHFSFVVQSDRIVEWGRNNPGRPRKHYGYNTSFAKIHSEIDAYRKARGLLDHRKGFELINVRVSRAGQIRMSRPCSCCFHLLSELGCLRFWYSVNVPSPSSGVPFTVDTRS